MTENAITDVCIVSDPLNCPGGYIIIDKTHDKKEDADLWKDNVWKKRTLRYLCVQHSPDIRGRDVLVDITIIFERDPVPHGYVCLEYTSDTKEKSMKKRQICVRYMASSLTQDSICDVAFVSRNKRPPPGYTMGGDLNNLQLCYKMAALNLVKEVSQSSAAPPGLGGVATNEGSLPYPVTAHDSNTLSNYGTHHRLERTASKMYNPMAGVPWQVNPRLENNLPILDGPLPCIEIKTYDALESKYNYSFEVEKNASNHIPPQIS